MIDIYVDVKWNGKDVKVKGSRTVNVSVFEAGKIIEAQAVAFAPVRTGRLRGSIATKTRDKEHFSALAGEAQSKDFIGAPVADGEAWVGTNLNYAKHVEYGTVKQIAQPFIRPAFDLSQGKTLTVFNKNGRNEFKEYFNERV